MGTPLIIENEISIKAPTGTVWELLTDPEMTKLYMYGCEVICTWQPGAEMLWKGSTDDRVYVKGNLVSLEPGKHLSYTVIDPNGDFADIPENYLTVTYDLSGDQNDTILRVTQGDYSKVEKGAERYKDSAEAGGWQSVLEKIKEIAEA
ncbi:MAG: SRPBCC domain-containing protein [Saprospiraceae bacterium]|nr:SRPBCC domain-containing protein [Saprospiraceae bacterium]